MWGSSRRRKRHLRLALRLWASLAQALLVQSRSVGLDRGLGDLKLECALYDTVLDIVKGITSGDVDPLKSPLLVHSLWTWCTQHLPAHAGYAEVVVWTFKQPGILALCDQVEKVSSDLETLIVHEKAKNPS